MDSRTCQTSTASPAEPGGLPASLGVEETHTVGPSLDEPQRSLPPARSNGQGNGTGRPAIREPQRMAQPRPTNGNVAGSSTPSGTKPNQAPVKPLANGIAPPTGADSHLITLRGVIGPIEADGSGNRVRRNGTGLDYVVFKITHNGSATTVYSKRPNLLAEITQRHGHEAAVRLSVVADQNRQYHVLEGFAEG